MNTPIFIINLPDATVRRESILSQCRTLDLNASLIEAVDGRRLTPEEVQRNYDKRKAIHLPRPLARELTLPEIGCALSHLSVYKKIIEEKLPYALILEDDAILGNETPEIIAALAEKLPENTPSLVLLTHVKYYSRSGAIALPGGASIVRHYPPRNWAGAYGYWITRAAAELLYNELFPVWSVSDDWDFFRKKLHLDIRALVPYCIGLSDAKSSLEADRSFSVSSAKKGRKRSPLFLLKDVFWRRFIHRFFIIPFAAKRQKKHNHL
jgi:glycosyl transferase family 25